MLLVEDLLFLLKLSNLSLRLLMILLILINSLTHLFLVFSLDLRDLALLLILTLVFLIITFLLIGLNVVLEHAMSILQVSLQLFFLLLLEVMLAQPKCLVFLKLSLELRVLSIDLVELDLPLFGLLSSSRLTG